MKYNYENNQTSPTKNPKKWQRNFYLTMMYSNLSWRRNANPASVRNLKKYETEIIGEICSEDLAGSVSGDTYLKYSIINVKVAQIFLLKSSKVLTVHRTFFNFTKRNSFWVYSQKYILDYPKCSLSPMEKKTSSVGTFVQFKSLRRKEVIIGKITCNYRKI